MIDEPGSFDGIINSPMPVLGPDDKNLMSSAIFSRSEARILIAPWALAMPPLLDNWRNLFESAFKSRPVSSDKTSAIFTS